MVVIRAAFRFLVFGDCHCRYCGNIRSGFLGFFSNQDEAAAASISMGDSADIRSPQNVEEFFLNLYLQSQADAVNSSVSDDPSPVPFTVEIGENAVTVAARLAEAQLVNDGDLFRLFLRYNQLDASLEAGDYVLQRNMNMREIAQALQKASFEEVSVTIPEGWRAEQVADLLDQENIMDGSLFLATVRQGVGVEHPLLADRPSGASYEGYLFPDTYRLPVNASPEDLIERMLDNMATKIPASSLEQAAGQGYTFFDILIIASIVEREAVIAEERPTIASVYLNRLAQGMYLQADPTVQYAMGYQPASAQWWKTPVTLEEYSQVNSPYNTYLNGGLPPGPISNPGASSILATLQPEPTNYLFFMGCGGDGAHLFAVDYSTHQVNVAACQ